MKSALATFHGKKASIFSWALFDWANSGFSVVITTFIFATYFTQKIAVNKIIGTSQWGDTIALASVVIAVISPILGAIADYKGQRKPWLASFTLLAIISASALWFSFPSPNYVLQTLFFVALGTIGIEIGMVFYNPMLKELAPEQYVGRVSGWAWGLGYFGGLTNLTIALFVFINGDISWVHLDKSTAEQIRICGPFVGVWLLTFGWPVFAFTPDRPDSGVTFKAAIKKGLQSLRETLTSVRKYREIMKFLVARILYIDGLNTMFAFGGIYAAGTFHMNMEEVIAFGITLNVGAGVGAFIISWLDDYAGSKITILISIAVMMLAGTGMLLVTKKKYFWLLGIVLSLCVGPIQSASRSLMVRLAPSQIITEMFGLYAFSGKATSFFGPWLLGLITYLTNSQRMGMSTIVVLLFLGGILLLFVNDKPKRAR